jgi:DNA modification methylase
MTTTDRLGRRFVGGDVDADSVAIGRKRLAEEIEKPTPIQGNGRK